jgi:2-phosphoglycerate kinase
MQEAANELTIYLVSGPLGVGKSTVSREIAHKIPRCALIEGDHLLHVFKREPIPEWEERLNLAWLHIASVTRNLIQRGCHVVIDFVVEDELEWFLQQVSDLEVTVKYVVMLADEQTLQQRLRQRGDSELLNRSLFLLNKLGSASINEPYLRDASEASPSILADEIIREAKYIIDMNGKG